MSCARRPQSFLGLSPEGNACLGRTTGNPDRHLVLRGGTETGPNFGAGAVRDALGLLNRAGLPEVLMIDCSHGNSEKDPHRQIAVVGDVIDQLGAQQRGIRALMLESHLVEGRQEYKDKESACYGQSITDACISIEQTATLFAELAGAVKRRRENC